MSRKAPNARALSGVTPLKGGGYRVRVSMMVNGNRTEADRQLPPGTSLEEAILAREQLRGELRQRLLAPPKVEEVSVAPTLLDYSDDWLARKALKLKASTLNQYTILLGEHVLTALADGPGGPLAERRLDAITRADLLAWRAELERAAQKGVSLKTVINRWSAGLRLMRDAWADYDLHDPSQRLDGPSGRHKPRRTQETLTPEEVLRFVEAATASRSGYSILLVVMAFTGMRRGEAIALRWEDVDLTQRVATVARSAVCVDGEWHVDTPKSGKPRRVGLVEVLVEQLREWRRTMVRGQHPGLKSGLVCPAPTGGFASLRGVRQACERASKAAELDIEVTPQVLRRSYNSIALPCADRLVLQATMGHMDDAMTSHYLHLSPEVLRAFADRVWEGAR